jgi:tRNA(Ile)-lysidine synthase
MDLLNLNEVVKLLEGSTDCLIGVSGGIDSMSLLTWFAQHKDQLPCKIRAMHVDHGINSNSSDWSKFVADTCQELGIDITTVKVSLDGLGNNIENAARKARYKAFCESGADSIVLAHHANDQCENFLLRLFRGSGIRGLKSMVPKITCWYNPNISIIRPMLDVPRTNIELWAEDNHVNSIDDPSNFDTKYDRNYLRNKIWPDILDRFGIADVNTVRSIKHLDEAWQLTTALADIDLATVTLSDGNLDWIKTKDLGYLRIKNLILRLLGQEGVYTFSIGQVEQFAQGLIDADLNNRNQLVTKNLTLNKIGKKIHIERLEKQVA